MEEPYIRITREFIVEPGRRLRQAGTVDPNNDFIDTWREIFEASLFIFCYVVLGRTYLTNTLHYPVCNWLGTTPPYRKMLLLPRNHAKTSIVSHGLPLHMLIQPLGGLYTPYKRGINMRIMLAGEVQTRADDNLRVIKSICEQNELFRAFWPDLVWDNPRREADKWTETEIVLPRTVDYPDPTIRAIGVGGAITGARHDAHIKDDMISLEAANSEITMQRAWDWHNTSRALLDNQDMSLEFVIGTRWAVSDVYSKIIAEDPSVDYVVRSAIEDGELIYPEHFTRQAMDQLQIQLGPLFSLLYMNNVGDPSLIDFPESDLRFFNMVEHLCEYEPDQRDKALEERYGDAQQAPSVRRGDPINWAQLGRHGGHVVVNAK